MRKYAKIVDNVVVDILLFTHEIPKDWPDFDSFKEVDDTVYKKSTWDGEVFTRPEKRPAEDLQYYDVEEEINSLKAQISALTKLIK